MRRLSVLRERPEVTPELLERFERSWPWVLALVLMGVGAFSAGRFSAPRQVETREVEKLVFRDLTVEDLTKGMTFTKTVTKTVWRNVETKPDGTVVDRSIEREGGTEASTTTEARRTTEEHTGERETEKTSTTTLQPSWRVGLQVGASLRPPALPITGPLVIGASVERRIVGGVSAGLWANTVGAGGASLSVEF
ncbi:MAG: hypothetical protein ACYC1Z_14260 [Georgenia sp.]